MKVRYQTLADYLDKVETQEQLAERLGISQPAISRAKYGLGSYRLLKKISKATGVPLDSFDRKDAA
jgi:transcriptional regulator with XRE-family HTH domain